MASRNLVLVMGYLGRTPELNKTEGGTAVCNLSVATTERWIDKDGREQERTEWVRVVVWGGQAEYCTKYLKTGSLVDVQGRLQTRPWTDDKGVERWATEVVAQRVQGLDRRPKGDDAPLPTDADAPERYRSGGGGKSNDGPPPDDPRFSGELDEPRSNSPRDVGHGSSSSSAADRFHAEGRDNGADDDERRVLRALGNAGKRIEITNWQEESLAPLKRLQTRKVVKVEVENNKAFATRIN
jgi:single-strand DNA-binding protein